MENGRRTYHGRRGPAPIVWVIALVVLIAAVVLVVVVAIINQLATLAAKLFSNKAKGGKA